MGDKSQESPLALVSVDNHNALNIDKVGGAGAESSHGEEEINNVLAGQTLETIPEEIRNVSSELVDVDIQTIEHRMPMPDAVTSSMSNTHQKISAPRNFSDGNAREDSSWKDVSEYYACEKPSSSWMDRCLC
ncbi:Glutamate-1-semialdehyde 2,1-aminomutase [Striga asiatica]|uniref:Glutamate-1-semialdehyde 2,1-aminomutase n=1 Tax=Striga asiatica TaxID=4170 RepID=A0A5A7R0R8_STRAF|nr:Glutamate-1-semialdehyde 2,1-aminomutase [Striga asiatica]